MIVFYSMGFDGTINMQGDDDDYRFSFARDIAADDNDYDGGNKEVTVKTKTLT